MAAERFKETPLNARTVGQGPPLLMLHGWGASSASFDPLSRLLAGAEMHLLDLPGFGGSPPPPVPWDLNDYARCVLAYMDERGIQRASVLGHSFGGRIALRLAAQHPGRVDRMVLVNAAGIPRRRTLEQRARMAGIKLLRRVLRWAVPLVGRRALDWSSERFGSRDYKAAGLLRPTFVRVINEDQTAELGKITCPTLILSGGLDTETPPEMAQRFHAAIGGSRIVVLPNGDHFMHEGDKAQLCAHYIRGFFEEHRDDVPR
jgi:pimeloyl-ACP methyl ester carboxylesterase